MEDDKTRINLNLLPLGSGDMIINMDWMEKYKVVLNCFDKTFTYLVEHKVVRTVKGIPKPISMRQIYVIQLKICLRKHCKIYDIWVAYLLLSEYKTTIGKHPILIEFSYVFPKDILGNRFFH